MHACTNTPILPHIFRYTESVHVQHHMKHMKRQFWFHSCIGASVHGCNEAFAAISMIHLQPPNNVCFGEVCGFASQRTGKAAGSPGSHQTQTSAKDESSFLRRRSAVHLSRSAPWCAVSIYRLHSHHGEVILGKFQRDFPVHLESEGSLKRGVNWLPSLAEYLAAASV